MSLIPAPDPQNLLLGKGELFFDRLSAAGVLQGYFHLGNCSKFEITLNDDLISINTSQDAAAGLLKRVTRKREVQLTITSNEYAIESMALALMGDSGTFTQASSAIAGEILTTSVVNGRFYKLANRNASAVVLTQGTVTLASGTAYTVYDATAGVIKMITASTTATPVTAAYTRASLSLDQILGATKTKIEGKLLFVPDPTTGPQVDVEVWHVSVAPSGTVGLVSEDWGEYALSLVALDDSLGTYGGGSTMPYFRYIQRGVA